MNPVASFTQFFVQPLRQIAADITFYPGYNGIKRYGNHRFLAAALSFSLLLDAFLVVNFYWTDMISASQRTLLLAVFAGVWLALTIFTLMYSCRLRAESVPEPQDEPLRQTLCHYLRGDWFAAESQILPYLKKYPKDAEMLLLQAAMYRRTNRCEEASLILDRLQLLNGSRYWLAEIEQERMRIRNAAVADAPHPDAAR